ncbi:14099_t:CDS:2, partial [Racocetra fulgida]
MKNMSIKLDLASNESPELVLGELADYNKKTVSFSDTYLWSNLKEDLFKYNYNENLDKAINLEEAINIEVTVEKNYSDLNLLYDSNLDKTDNSLNNNLDIDSLSK